MTGFVLSGIRITKPFGGALLLQDDPFFGLETAGLSEFVRAVATY